VTVLTEPVRREIVAVIADPDGSLAQETEQTFARLGLGGAAAGATLDELLEHEGETDVVLIARMRDGVGKALHRLLEQMRLLDPNATAAVLHGREPPTLGEALAEILAEHRRARRAVHRRAGNTLTRRELEVLRLGADGASNREIAARLWLSPETVKFHLRNAYRKLGVGNRSDAVDIATARGLMPSLLPEVPGLPSPNGRRGVSAGSHPGGRGNSA
jgi:DNA-binding CsgD family transcriptional regulator